MTLEGLAWVTQELQQPAELTVELQQSRSNTGVLRSQASTTANTAPPGWA